MKKLSKLILIIFSLIGFSSFIRFDSTERIRNMPRTLAEKIQLLDDDGASLVLMRLDGTIFFYNMVYGLDPVEVQIPYKPSIPHLAKEFLTDSHFLFFLQKSPLPEGLMLINLEGDQHFISSPLANYTLQTGFPSPLGDRFYWVYDVSPVPISLSDPCDEKPDCTGYVYEVLSSDLSGGDIQSIIRIETGVKNYGLQLIFDGWNLQKNAFRINASFSLPSALYLPEHGLTYEIYPLSGEMVTKGSLFQGLLLSPDGKWSANAYWENRSIFEIQERIKNEFRNPELIFGEGTLVDQLHFSPSGSSLAWIALNWDSSQYLIEEIALQVMDMNCGDVRSLLLSLPETDQFGNFNLPYIMKWINEKYLVVNTENGSHIFNLQTMNWDTRWDTVLHGEDDYLILGLLAEPFKFSQDSL